MKKFNMLGKRVLVRTPQSKDVPEYLPGRICDYNIETNKASIVATRPEGFECTYHGVPYDTNMALEVPNSGCWCNFKDLVVKSDAKEEKATQPKKQEATS
jgi:hypothetical protein